MYLKCLDLTGKGKRAVYDAGFKLRVVELAEQSNNCVTAWEFGVNEKMVRDSQQKKDALDAMQKAKKVRRGGMASFPQLEVALND